MVELIRGRSRARRVPYVPQMELAECGAACLAMVLAHAGRHVPLSQVREDCGVSRDGSSAHGIARAAEAHGMATRAYRVDVGGLAKLSMPLIVHWELNHFVVLERIGRGGGVIVDPARGRRRVDRAALRRSFSGIALAFERGPHFEPKRAAAPSARRYAAVAKRAVPSLALMAGVSLLLNLLGLVIPAAPQLVVDFVVRRGQIDWLWGVGLVLGAVVLLRAPLILLRGRVIQNLQLVLDFALMGGFLKHLLALPLAFFRHRTAGDLLKRVQGNVALREFFSNRSASALLDVALIAGYAALMLAYHAPLGALVIVLACVRVAIVALRKPAVDAALTTELAAAGREGGALVEALSSAEAVRAFGMETTVADRYADRLMGRLNAQATTRRTFASIAQSLVMLDAVARASVLWVGGREVLADRMTLGVFAAFLVLQGLFQSPLESLLRAVIDLSNVLRLMDRLDDVLETPAERADGQPAARVDGAVRLRGVEVKHGASPAVLQGVDLDVRPGEFVAILGRSGAGKSTLAGLIAGLVTPSAGRVEVGEADLASVDLTALRARIGVVFQDESFFDDTIRANITLRDPEVPLARVQQAARAAEIADFIESLPDGYDAAVGGDARLLSKGQRQRLALARALVNDPQLLVLDEATSSLDPETERLVVSTIRKLSCTRIVVTHRLESARQADRVVVIEAGRIVQSGRFSDLVTMAGPCRELCAGRAS